RGARRMPGGCLQSPLAVGGRRGRRPGRGIAGLRRTPTIPAMATTEDRREQLTGQDAWREELYEATPERQGELFSTISGVENEPLYTPDNVEVEYERELGYPGVFPFTRGVYPSM